jgi:hypothetical protein
MVLEQDHRRLNRVVESKTAADAELFDFRENERLEDSFVISGLRALPSTLTGKDWQTQAVADVQSVVRKLIGKEVDIIVVQNVTSRKPDSEVTYNVKLTSVEASRLVRRTFGSYFPGGKDTRPTHLKEISIKNRVTPETKIRVSILKLMAKRYRDSNPGSRVQVIGYDPRPLIKITPPSSASDRRVKIFNYVEACRQLPTNFAQTDLDPIIRRINPRLRGSIKSTFIVISDDQFMPRSGNAIISASTTSSEAAEATDQDPAEADITESGTNSRRGLRRGATSPPGSPSSAKR